MEQSGITLKDCCLKKTSPEIADRVRLAHARLPILFRQIKIETKLIYPFKYNSTTGEFLYPELERCLRNNVASGNGKARALSWDACRNYT